MLEWKPHGVREDQRRIVTQRENSFLRGQKEFVTAA